MNTMKKNQLLLFSEGIAAPFLETSETRELRAL
jgi:hypothetical protein